MSDATSPSAATPTAAPGAAPASDAAPTSRELVLDARGITRSYRMGSTKLDVLRGADMQLARGEIVAIIGRSGTGKSTLLHLLGLLDRPDAGTLRLAGTETTGLGKAARAKLRNRHVGFVFQFYHLFPELNALENAMLPAMITHGILAWPGKRRAARERATALLERLGLGERLKHKPGQLSGGERQRVAIARALAGEPGMLLCDEPTGNLDERTSESITNLLLELAREHGQSLVLVTHDPELARRADRCLTMHDGLLVAAEPGEEIAHPTEPGT